MTQLFLAKQLLAHTLRVFGDDLVLSGWQDSILLGLLARVTVYKVPSGGRLEQEALFYPAEHLVC